MPKYLRVEGKLEEYNPFDVGECERMVELLAKDMGVVATAHQIDELWNRYSDTQCAGWLMGLDKMSAGGFLNLMREHRWIVVEEVE